MSFTALIEEKRTLTVILAGNPNSGKTTVFNALTNLRQKVGNYPGVTVEKKMGRMTPVRDGSDDTSGCVNILDLPGTYSLAVRSPDEKVARDVLLGRMVNTPPADLVVCVVDASNLERNLYLVSQIQDLGLPLMVALNMMDTAKEQGSEINAARLQETLGIRVIPTVATQGRGIEDLKKAILKIPQRSSQRRWRMPEIMESEIQRLMGLLVENDLVAQKAAFGEALLLLSQEDLNPSYLDGDLKNHKEIFECVESVRTNLTAQSIHWRSAAIEARYGWIQHILKDVVRCQKIKQITRSDQLDSILTHRFWGWLIFLGLMAFMFFMIFSAAAYPMDWISQGAGALTDFVKSWMPPGDLRSLMTDGVIAGVGAVVTFLPQILILFFFIGLLQDTGYMTRAAFIMDRLMSKVGLHGKSFIPLLSSFACAIPGIMAARTIENPKDRLVTILVAPLMSCSARLPVYTLMIATLIPKASALEKAGLMLSMYLLGMIGAFLMAWIFKKTLLKSQTPVLIMELPPYRWPSLKTVLWHMWERSRLFLRRAGTIIFGLSIILWALMSYPKHNAINATEGIQKSFAGMAGVALEPIIKPLGYDWRIGIGLIGSFAAREVFVSTMNIVFSINNEGGATTSLADVFGKAQWPDGQPLFTPLVCLSLMIFYVFAMQCMSTLTVVYHETNGWRWPLFQLVYMTGLAYVLAFFVFQGGRLLGWQ